MGTLSGGDLLALWEQAAGLDPPRQALVLATATTGAPDAEELAALPVGARDARLLELRCQVAGRELAATAVCPACDEAVEFSLDADALLAVPTATADTHTTDLDGMSITWRCPTGGDLVHLASLDEAATAESVLLGRCILDASAVGGASLDVTSLPQRLREAVTNEMADADPLAEVLADVTCSECGSAFTADVDVAEFAWIEVRAAALSLLREIDVLARAYGWTEAEVLELSDARRAAYLALALERS